MGADGLPSGDVVSEMSAEEACRREEEEEPTKETERARARGWTEPETLGSISFHCPIKKYN